MEKMVYIDKCPPLGSYPNKSGQNLECKSPRAGPNFWCKSSGVRGGGMVMDEIDTCIISVYNFALIGRISKIITSC